MLIAARAVILESPPKWVHFHAVTSSASPVIVGASGLTLESPRYMAAAVFLNYVDTNMGKDTRPLYLFTTPLSRQSDCIQWLGGKGSCQGLTPHSRKALSRRLPRRGKPPQPFRVTMCKGVGNFKWQFLNCLSPKLYLIQIILTPVLGPNIIKT